MRDRVSDGTLIFFRKYADKQTSMYLALVDIDQNLWYINGPPAIHPHHGNGMGQAVSHLSSEWYNYASCQIIVLNICYKTLLLIP